VARAVLPGIIHPDASAAQWVSVRPWKGRGGLVSILVLASVLLCSCDAPASSRREPAPAVVASHAPHPAQVSGVRPSLTPKPTFTPRPTCTSTPTRTDTPTPTDTLMPSETPTPSHTPSATPTCTPEPSDTPAPTPSETPTPTVPSPTPPPTLEPTAPPPSGGDVRISGIHYDGEKGRSEPDEYCEIVNQGGAAVDMKGWRLNAGNPGQDFFFPEFTLGQGQTCRVYTNESHPDSGGFSFGSGRALWANKGDCGYLYDASGREVGRYCY